MVKTVKRVDAAGREVREIVKRGVGDSGGFRDTSGGFLAEVEVEFGGNGGGKGEVSGEG